jgi:hypothetical protein
MAKGSASPNGGGGGGGFGGMNMVMQAMDAATDEEKRKKREAEKNQMPSMKTGGSVSASKRADGCAVKGKTKGAMIKMAKGGKAC